MIITADTMTIQVCKDASCSVWEGGYEFLDDGILLRDDPPDESFTYGFRDDYPLSVFFYSNLGYYYENWEKIANRP